ncbi:MAG TPA: hypothetical protein PLE77_07445 [Kiritimatiellia bacterium]|nr:hypothetical protein [Kiritimatiellia bacterium]
MKFPKRSPLFWIVVALFAGLTIWWTLFVPYAPEQIWKAIPAEAVFVSEHRNLAARWDAFSRNPFTRSLLTTVGLTPPTLQNLSRDPESKKWLDALTARDSVLAFVPQLGAYREPAWVFASWIGGRSQRLRWSLAWQRGGGFKRGPAHHGRAYWVVEDLDIGGDHRLTIAFVEGMLVGCLSRHPEAILEVLDTYDGLMPSVADVRNMSVRGPWCTDPVAPDRGWFDPASLERPRPVDSKLVAYEFSELLPDTLAGQICGAAPFAFAQSTTPRLKADGLEEVLGELPQAVVIARTAMVLPALEEEKNPFWVRQCAELIRGQKASTVMLAVLGDDYSGRFHGIRVPTLLIGIPAAQPDAAVEWVPQAFDRLNARYRCGLISRELAAGEQRFYVVEGTVSSNSAALTLDERPAYAVVGKWLLFSSNLEALRKVAAFANRGGSQAAGTPVWARSMNETPAPAYGWIDLARGGKNLRLAVTTYSLKLLLEDPRGTYRVRQQLNDAKAWIDALMPLQICRFWVRSDGVMMEGKFRMGKDELAEPRENGSVVSTNLERTVTK